MIRAISFLGFIWACWILLLLNKKVCNVHMKRTEVEGIVKLTPSSRISVALGSSFLVTVLAFFFFLN